MNKKLHHWFLAALCALLTTPPAFADMLGHGGMVRSIAVSPDGSRVLTGSFDYTAMIWDFGDQTSTGVLEGHDAPVNSVAYLPNGRQAVTGSDDNTIILWDLAKKSRLRRYSGHRGKIMSVAVSSDGRRIASGSWDRTVRIWNTVSGTELLRINHPTNITAVNFFNHGKNFITGTRDGIIRLWRSKDGIQTGELRGHSWVIAQIAVSPDQKHAFSSSTDGTVRLWDLSQQKELAILKGHEGPVFSVAFSPDGRGALTGGRDGLLIHWDIATRAQRRVIRTHIKPIWAVTFSRDGKFGLSAGSDGATRVWHLATGDRIGIPGEGDAGPKPWLESKHPGARTYRKCAACHSLSAEGPRRSGPNFAGLFGRPVGSVSGYRYSEALKSANFQWNEKTLFALFNKGPDIFLPGTKMPVQRIPDKEQLNRLIAYLRILTNATPSPLSPGGSR
jgi:cytochrome c